MCTAKTVHICKRLLGQAENTFRGFWYCCCSVWNNWLSARFTLWAHLIQYYRHILAHATKTNRKSRGPVSRSYLYLLLFINRFWNQKFYFLQTLSLQTMLSFVAEMVRPTGSRTPQTGRIYYRRRSLLTLITHTVNTSSFPSDTMSVELISHICTVLIENDKKVNMSEEDDLIKGQRYQSGGDWE